MAFRGHGDAPQLLHASIERVASKPGIAEEYIEREFKRRAHHYLADLPNEDEDLEWLALMQHYGAPTRLLDWTRSAYVAAFFAADGASSPNAFAVWAVDQQAVNTRKLRPCSGFPKAITTSHRVRILEEYIATRPRQSLSSRSGSAVSNEQTRYDSTRTLSLC